ncbi:hypothetical protein FJ970_10580 [Mesorhizobium sp. B2-1-8]|uniref:hypothetical protein n=1 Tax=Mesorhizobium sp. B2-1-8 TaxID=2589967 RepID=UPI00112D33C7|nr:hypothetical protein [Mesorhizobium sp. B2-1-8]UCI21365.1 hypothetical protein FJ970_10580 [Mesorhizobium sp. B2-1-8]
MSRVAFYGGVVLIFVGVVYWILRPSSPAQKNIIKLPGGFEFELNTPSFALIVFGIMLMLISQQFPEWVGPKPPPDSPPVVWLQKLVISPKELGAASTYSNPCTGTSDSDTIYPLHPGGHFVPNTRTTNRSTTDVSHYSEIFTVDRSDQVSVTIGQSTGACEHRQFANGRLQAMETYPQAGP